MIVLALISALLACGQSAPSDVTGPAADNLPPMAGVPSAGDPQPGDDLPPEQDNAAGRSCGEESAPSGSKVIRALSAGPRLANGSLAFVAGLCIYLPPGYDNSGKRYPVIYWLHGGGAGQQILFRQILDAAYAGNPDNAVIMVGPDGTGLASWFDRYDGINLNPQGFTTPEGFGYTRTLNETYVLRWVIPYVDRHFRSIATRRGRAIAGLSNGGHGSMLLAAKAPDLFAAASSMSGNVAWKSLGLSSEQFLDVTGLRLSPAYRMGNIPVNLAENLDDVDLIFDIGAECPNEGQSGALCSDPFYQSEQVFVDDNRALQAALANEQHVGANDYRETVGGHEQRWWNLWFEQRHLPFLLQRLANPQPQDSLLGPAATPEVFRYRSIAPSFSVYGYDVAATRSVSEFLDLLWVTQDSLAVKGSGAATITTAARYQPGHDYRVTGAGAEELRVRADDRGRLQIPVDLGPSHQLELDGLGDLIGLGQLPTDHSSWVTRDVEISF